MPTTAPAATHPAAATGTFEAPVSPAQRLKGAPLLARVLAINGTVCPRGGGPMRMIAALTDPDSIRTYLTGVGRLADPRVA